MTSVSPPFALPTKLSPRLHRVLDYWLSLKRGENSMPFWDDVKPSSLPDLSSSLMLIDAFESPQRFRFASIGQHIGERYGSDLAGSFADAVEARAPLRFLIAQASATVEAKVPTFFADGVEAAGGRRSGYSRLLLPMWGNGRIGMLLGAIEYVS